MAADLTINTYFPNAIVKSSDGSGNITGAAASKTYFMLRVDDFPQLAAGECTPGNGSEDVRKTLFAILDLLATNYAAEVTGGTAPEKMTISHSPGINSTGDTVTHYYTFKFVNSISGQDVASE